MHSRSAATCHLNRVRTVDPKDHQCLLRKLLKCCLCDLQTRTAATTGMEGCSLHNSPWVRPAVVATDRQIQEPSSMSIRRRPTKSDECKTTKFSLLQRSRFADTVRVSKLSPRACLVT